MNIEKIKTWIIENKLVVALFLLSTCFFIIQNYFTISWDFSSHVLNAKYWFGNGTYFEWYRAPLMPFIIGLFSFVGFKLAEYLFIIFVSALFFYSTIRLAEVAKLNKTIFYLFSLSPFVLLFGLINGTELLSLALLELFIILLVEKRYYAGLFLGLAFLSRYNFLIFAPLILFNFKIKKILQNSLMFLVAIVPWFIYNYHIHGNFLTSIANSYILNVGFREYTIQIAQYWHFFMIGYILLPLFILGIIIVLYNWKKYKIIDLIILVTLVLIIYQYLGIPIKDVRYLFAFSLPLAYFATKAFDKINKISKKIGKYLIMIILLAMIAYFSVYSMISNFQTDDKYLAAINVLNEQGLSECRIFSNSWPIINYFGKLAEPMPQENTFSVNIKNGYIYLLFFDNDSKADIEVLARKYANIYRTEEFVLLGIKDMCIQERVLDHTYLKDYQSRIIYFDNYIVNINPCFILFEDKPILEKSCNLINLNGFKLDENRLT